MLESNKQTLQTRAEKLLKDHKLIKETFAARDALDTAQCRGTNKVTELLKKFLQYRSECTSSHKQTEAHIKLFAFNLYCSKPRIYKHLKSILGLPDEKDFQNFSINLSPVFEESQLYFLSSKLNSLRPELNHFVLCVDKIRLNRNFVYDTKRDVVLGFHNISGAILNQSATHAYIILLRSVRTNWVQLVAYAFVSENVSYLHQLASWCKNVISQMLKCGIQVYALVTSPDCLEGESHRISSHLNSGINNCFTFENNEEVYELHDIPYMIKAVRDCLINSDFGINDSNISWYYIKTLFYQKDFLSDLTLDITAAHIHPESAQTSHLNIASELFSMNVYNAFDQLIKKDILPPEARTTADFVKIMSRLCDIVNYNPKSNITFSIDQQLEVLNSTLEMFNKIGCVEPAITDMKKALLAMLKFLGHLKKQEFRHVYMSRLNMAPLSAFFRSIPRVAKDGRRLRPTASQVLAAFRERFVADLRRRVRRPRAEDLAEAARCGLLDARAAPAAPAAPLRLPRRAAHRLPELPRPGAAETYIAAFLLHRCMEVHTCPELDRCLSPRQYLFESQNKEIEYYKTLNKSCDFYGKLLKPPEKLVTYVRRLLLACPMSGSRGADVLRQMASAGAPPRLCGCFPRRLPAALLARLLLWHAARRSNAGLRRRIAQQRFLMPRIGECSTK